jgi:hypothetical protein
MVVPFRILCEVRVFREQFQIDVMIKRLCVIKLIGSYHTQIKAGD